MAYDLQEQEQLEAIKAWWDRYAKLVVAAAIACLLTIAAFQGWRYYRHQQSLAAVTLYEQLVQAERANDAKKVRDIAAQVIDNYSRTPYAAMAALSAARASFESGDLAASKVQLQWVIDNAGEEELRDVARLRLAGVLLDEKKYAEALALADVRHVASFGGLYADLKGDILLAQGKLAEARSAYQAALEKSDAQSPYRPMIQAKLDALGDTK
ncbi:MAG: tetratricopeptide repeat protein [Betaproteobacteria bacterium]|nr:tetratricopeptide repeat protein [Betaproteobacteria bacterium]